MKDLFLNAPLRDQKHREIRATVINQYLVIIHENTFNPDKPDYEILQYGHTENPKTKLYIQENLESIPQNLEVKTP